MSHTINATGPVVRTARGTVIERYARTGVGKRMGPRLYVHRIYTDLVCPPFPAEILDAAMAVATEVGPKERFDYNCLCLNLTDPFDVRFDEAPDFDTAREPHVGRWMRVYRSGSIVRGHSDAILHHRWAWVRPEYIGFDVEESRRWSARYSPLIARAPSGSARAFARQLAEAGLR